MNEAGLNLGYGHIKIRTGTQYTAYPSIAFPASDSFTGLGFDRKTRHVIYQGVRYEIGEDAALLAQDPLGGKVLRRRWLNSTQYQVLRQSVIDLLAEESTKPWNLVLGVAVDHFKETEYVRQMQAAWSGTLTSSDGKSFPVEQCKIVPEPMGAYWSMILGNPDLKKQCKNIPVLVIDLGYYTTDWLTIYEHAIVPGNSSGIDMGMHTLYLDLQKHIAQFYNISLDIVQIEAMVREERPLETKNQSVSFSHLLSPIREKIFPKIVSELLVHLDSVRKRNAIIFVTGGGASYLLPYIQESFPESRVLHSADPQRDNADGYWMLARVLGQPESPAKAQDDGHAA